MRASEPGVEAAVDGVGGDGRGELVHSSAIAPQRTTIGAEGVDTTVNVYDDAGSRLRTISTTGVVSVVLPAGGFAIAEG